MEIKLIYGSPETDANLLYWGRVFTLDAFLAFEADGKRYAFSNVLDAEEMKKNSAFDIILLTKDLKIGKFPKFTDIVKYILKQFPKKEIILPENFPAKFLLQLQENKIPFSVREGIFLQERSIKKSFEIEEIKKACKIASEAFAKVKNIISNAEIVDGFLKFNGEFLTSERLQEEISNVCFRLGAIAKETIVSCGKESAYPHVRGNGILRSNEFIVIDIFPRIIKTGYYGDMTRTFLKGIPSDAQKNMYNAVKSVHENAINVVKSGVDASSIHEKNISLFQEIGYKTTENSGFFHSTGHGVGLELHEMPCLCGEKHILRSGEVVTIEPGLYYEKLGGVRIEDVVAVGDSKSELLSNFSYDWIL